MKSILKEILVVFLLLASINISYARKGHAKVECKNVEKYQSTAGMINIAQYTLGRVIILDTVNKKGFYLVSINLPSNTLTQSDVKDSEVVLTSAGFDISLSGQVASAKANIQADVKSSVTNNTTFYLKNSVSESIDPTATINSDVVKFSTIKNALINNRNCIVVIVSTILFADEFGFQLRNNANAGADANILKVGKFNISVDYTCQGSLQINAKKGGVFYRVTPFSLNIPQNALVFTAYNFDLSQYTMNQTNLY